MNHMIDECEYCGTFQRITIEMVEENGDARAICSNCLLTFWNLEDQEQDVVEDHVWEEVF